MRLLVTGASGLLGRAVVAHAHSEGHEVKGIAFRRASEMESVDLTDRDAISRVISSFAPDAVIHTAAERRPDAVERDPEGSHALNVDAPAALASACAALPRPAYLVALSTDYVFDGTQPPYHVNDTPNPLNAYGAAKVEAEKAVDAAASPGRASCVRIPVLYGPTEYNGESAVNVLMDAVRSGSEPRIMDACAVRYPTCVSDVARAVVSLCDIAQHRDMPHIVHFSAREAMTKYDMCLVIARVWNNICGKEVASSSHLEPQFEVPAGSTPRPGNCKLDLSETVALGVNIDCVGFEEWWRDYLSSKEVETEEKEEPQQESANADSGVKEDKASPAPGHDDTKAVADEDKENQATPALEHDETRAVADDDETRYGTPTPTKALPQEPPIVFEMSVTDPQKVGDALGGHVVYRVRTKSNAPWLHRSEASVLRRYSDFRWLHAALVENNPGVIVPPVPEKVKLGRFAPDVVEFRRRSLELAISKIVQHPRLQRDEDLHMFLQSTDLAADIHARDLIKGPVVTPEHRSYFSWSQTFQAYRFQETDEWFNQQVEYLGSLESILRVFVAAVVELSQRRIDHCESLEHLSRTLAVLSDSTLSRGVSTCFAALAEAQKRQAEAQTVLAEHEANILRVAFYEYERLTGSVRKAFATRVDTWNAWQHAESELNRSRGVSDGHMDVHLQQRYNVSLRAVALRTRFDEVTRTCKLEMERFESEKVSDLRRALAAYIELAQHTQESVMEEWNHCANIIKRQMPASDAEVRTKGEGAT